LFLCPWSDYMFRFCKPDGTSFGLDYNGAIQARSADDEVVAMCRGEQTFDLKAEFLEEIDTESLTKEETEDLEEELDDLDEVTTVDDPTCFNDWEIIIKMKDKRALILQHSLATAFNALMLCERII
jgi:hypothetical protein